MRQESAALKGELSEMRAESKAGGSLDDVQARLDKIENCRARKVTARSRLGPPRR